jgi:hypothetical protein
MPNPVARISLLLMAISLLWRVTPRPRRSLDATSERWRAGQVLRHLQLIEKSVGILVFPKVTRRSFLLGRRHRRRRYHRSAAKPCSTTAPRRFIWLPVRIQWRTEIVMFMTQEAHKFRRQRRLAAGMTADRGDRLRREQHRHPTTSRAIIGFISTTRV